MFSSTALGEIIENGAQEIPSLCSLGRSEASTYIFKCTSYFALVCFQCAAFEYKTDQTAEKDANPDDDFFFRRLSGNDLGLNFDDDDDEDVNLPEQNRPTIGMGGFLQSCSPQKEEEKGREATILVVLLLWWL